MNISLDLIKQLREKSGAGMADCKNALTEAEGDLEKAMEILRKKGITKAAKRSDRETTEGLVKVATNEDSNEGYIFQINAETDFVVRSEQFQNFAERLIQLVKAARPATKEELLAIALEEGGTILEALENLSSVVGEKLEIKQYDMLTSGGSVAGYIHGAGNIGVLVAIDKSGSAELAREIAMQVAAVNPRYISPEEVTEEEIAKEKEIYAEQLSKEGKPAEMIEKILAGKINKYFEEICLTKQEFIKDDSKKICDILGDAKVEKFIRYSL
ncbi:MAG: Elongation factor Ts [Candidatus Falkowbacteria bacterium GW2011_GWF2_39_8]|uniref:Elongation factor Ts n=1 Tax=Candidatus Falkowbacteria bacterium GW2011_GWF2_39_8 TaxID=1618642 RepID=A0A0G0PX19_9BACT|nr:MAG: Elongation factor Ts [Candidatus Falkowbacteria bacterium GW2011_GWF2_39_8]